MVPSTWPAVTFWPTATSTALSVPLAPKSMSSTVLGATVPEAVTVDCTVPVVTVAVRVAAWADERWKMENNPKKISTAATTTRASWKTNGREGLRGFGITTDLTGRR
jgi:hypothetical protein